MVTGREVLGLEHLCELLLAGHQCSCRDAQGRDAQQGCWVLHHTPGQTLFPGLFAAERPSSGAAVWCMGKHTMC